MAEQKKKKSIFSRIGNFFKEVKIEAFKRITWPTPHKTLNHTIVVIVVVLIVAVFVGVLDLIFNWGLDLLLR